MADLDLAKKLLTKLRHVPNPTPAKMRAEFRRLLAAEEATRLSQKRPLRENVS